MTVYHLATVETAHAGRCYLLADDPGSDGDPLELVRWELPPAILAPYADASAPGTGRTWLVPVAVLEPFPVAPSVQS
jgi:hypothetical protein